MSFFLPGHVQLSKCAKLYVTKRKNMARKGRRMRSGKSGRNNRKLPHSTIGYQIPAESMGAFFSLTWDNAIEDAATTSSKALCKAA